MLGKLSSVSGWPVEQIWSSPFGAELLDPRLQDIWFIKKSARLALRPRFLLTECLVAVVLNAATSFVDARFYRGESAAAVCSAFGRILCRRLCAGQTEGDRVQDALGPSATTYLLTLILSFFGGWLLGIMGAAPRRAAMTSASFCRWLVLSRTRRL